MHGIGFMHDEYQYLGTHLAQNGIVTASVLQNALLQTVECLSSVLYASGELSGNVVFSGHSAGGQWATEAAVAAAGMSNIALRGLAVMAPRTQAWQAAAAAQFDYSSLPAALVLNGTRDCDTKGQGITWYDVLGDEDIPWPAQDVTKTIAWIRGANHSSFSDDSPMAPYPPLDPPDQRRIAKAYYAAFVRAYVFEEQEMFKYLAGTELPATVQGIVDTSSADVQIAYSQGGTAWGRRRVIDSFEQVDRTTYAAVCGSDLVPGPDYATLECDGSMHLSIGPSASLSDPHGTRHGETRSMLAEWTGTSYLRYELDEPLQDIRSFDFLSLRVGQIMERSPVCDQLNPEEEQFFRIVLTDDKDVSKSYLVGVSPNETLTIPDLQPDPPPGIPPCNDNDWSDLDCHAEDFMRTVRIPVTEFCEGLDGQHGVDIGNLRTIEFWFDQTSEGKLLIDSLELARNEWDRTELSNCAPLCGNGQLEPANGEECDDGNYVSGDGCSADCKIEKGPSDPAPVADDPEYEAGADAGDPGGPCKPVSQFAHPSNEEAHPDGPAFNQYFCWGEKTVCDKTASGNPICRPCGDPADGGQVFGCPCDLVKDHCEKSGGGCWGGEGLGWNGPGVCWGGAQPPDWMCIEPCDELVFNGDAAYCEHWDFTGSPHWAGKSPYADHTAHCRQDLCVTCLNHPDGDLCVGWENNEPICAPQCVPGTSDCADAGFPSSYFCHPSGQQCVPQ